VDVGVVFKEQHHTHIHTPRQSAPARGGVALPW